MSLIIAGIIAVAAISPSRNLPVTAGQSITPPVAQLPTITSTPTATPTTAPTGTPMATPAAAPIDTPTPTQDSANTATPALAATPEPTTGPPVQRPVAGIGTGSDSQCEASYPEFCVPSNASDLDCKDVAPHKNFKVKGDDPHRFDADNDGLGCEPYDAADPAPKPKPTKKPGNKPKPDRNCDPSYPTLCLPSSPDLDCGDVNARRFPVRGRDPHGFDGDGDGIGCESG